MKKIVSLLLAVVLLATGLGSALAATKTKGNKYSLPKEGTVLQDVADRGIKPQGDSTRHTMIPGESPTTGLPWSGDYLPMIVQISNAEGSAKVNGKNVNAAGIGERAPWSGQYADIVFEGILYRTGATRISFLFSDSFAENQPQSAGPVRSARIGHVLLREEWESGFVYAGGPRREDNNIRELFAKTGADDKGVLFDLLSGSWVDLKNRVGGVKAPDNYNANLLGLRQQIPASYAATPRPFLFSDESPYTEGYEYASAINLDWGDKKYISHFYYDEAENLYLRYSGDAPYMTFAAAEDRSDENMEQMSFSNVIIQRVHYDYVNNNKIMPDMQSVGQGNADIFIGGRYIPGYWVRKAVTEPTVFYDDKGQEIQLARGKTFIAHFPPESMLTFSGIE
ncbi:MAG: DUF3048 C-terminal domain-containing protein [Candidatus Limiplasma sp.]|nr:DUF3048 C-terminal domain-containing protein [Candidatus Limiplasma sp.]